MDTLLKISEIILSPVVIGAGVWYLLRKYLDTHFTKEVEQFKSTLQLEAVKSQAEFTTNLKATLFEFQTKFSLFHSKQADAVAELYGLLADAKSHIEKLTFIMQPSSGVTLKESKDKAYEIYAELSRYHHHHRIYFSDELNQKIESAIDVMSHSLSQFDVAHTWGMHSGDKYTSDDTGAWRKAWETISTELPPLMRELETHFHNILEGKYDDRRLKQ